MPARQDAGEHEAVQGVALGRLVPDRLGAPEHRLNDRLRLFVQAEPPEHAAEVEARAPGEAVVAGHHRGAPQGHHGLPGLHPAAAVVGDGAPHLQDAQPSLRENIPRQAIPGLPLQRPRALRQGLGLGHEAALEQAEGGLDEVAPRLRRGPGPAHVLADRLGVGRRRHPAARQGLPEGEVQGRALLGREISEDHLAHALLGELVVGLQAQAPLVEDAALHEAVHPIEGLVFVRGGQDLEQHLDLQLLAVHGQRVDQRPIFGIDEAQAPGDGRAHRGGELRVQIADLGGGVFAELSEIIFLVALFPKDPQGLGHQKRHAAGLVVDPRQAGLAGRRGLFAQDILQQRLELSERQRTELDAERRLPELGAVAHAPQARGGHV